MADTPLRLAAALDGAKLIDDRAEWAETLEQSASELRRLHAEVERLTEECRIRKACDESMQHSLGEYHAERDELRIKVTLLTEELSRLRDHLGEGNRHE